MITDFCATRARNMAYESSQDEINKVFDLIKQAAKEGEISLRFRDKLSEATILYLTKIGKFEINGSNTSRFVDGTGKYHFTIRWDN